MLFALVIVAGTLHRTGLLGVFALSALSALWLLGNKGVEHQTLLTLSSGHGITTLDAAGIAGLLLVLAQIVRSVLARDGRDDTGDDTPEPPEETAAKRPTDEPADGSA